MVVRKRHSGYLAGVDMSGKVIVSLHRHNGNECNDKDLENSKMI
jgi:hypothetical protein